MAALKDIFHGRLALVTGGSSGIGLALAQLLAEQGTNVWLMARRQEQLEKAQKSLAVGIGQKHGVVAADITNWDQVRAAVQHVRDEAGVPEVLINAAGASHPGYLQATSLETYRQMMDLNYFGTVHSVMAWLPALLDRGSGYIVNFSSEAGFLAPFGYAAYAPSKYAVRGFSDILRLELKPLGVRVSVVFPPDTDTPGMEKENKTKPFETLEAFSNTLHQPKGVANDIMRGMKRGQYIILPGFEINLHYRLMFLAGNAVYPIFDALLAQARRKKAKN